MVFSTPTDVSGLRDKVALVTGGASGLGRATAYELAAAGVEVVVADVDEAAGAEVASAVGGHFVRCDVSSLAENEAMVDFAVEQCGEIHLAFLNAGVTSGTGIGPDFDEALYRRAMGINCDGVIFGTQAVLRAMGPGGRIVATSSLAGLLAVPMDVIYCANKHAVVGFVRSMGPVLAEREITINAVCPGFAETAIIADIRSGLVDSGFDIIPAETVAATVVRLMASDVTAQCWFVQPWREPAEFVFRNVPGPGAKPAPADG